MQVAVSIDGRVHTTNPIAKKRTRQAIVNPIPYSFSFPLVSTHTDDLRSSIVKTSPDLQRTTMRQPVRFIVMPLFLLSSAWSIHAQITTGLRVLSVEQARV